MLSSEIFWEKEDGDLSLSSYTVKTSKGLRNVLMLSTMRPLLGVTRDDGNNKPALYKLYDFTKGGTEDQNDDCHNSGRIGRDALTASKGSRASQITRKGSKSWQRQNHNAKLAANERAGHTCSWCVRRVANCNT